MAATTRAVAAIVELQASFAAIQMENSTLQAANAVLTGRVLELEKRIDAVAISAAAEAAAAITGSGAAGAPLSLLIPSSVTDAPTARAKSPGGSRWSKVRKLVRSKSSSPRSGSPSTAIHLIGTAPRDATSPRGERIGGSTFGLGPSRHTHHGPGSQHRFVSAASKVVVAAAAGSDALLPPAILVTKAETHGVTLNGEYRLLANKRADGAGVWCRPGRGHGRDRVDAAYVYRSSEDHYWFIGDAALMEHNRGYAHQMHTDAARQRSPVGLDFDHGAVVAVAPPRTRKAGGASASLPLRILVPPTNQATRRGSTVKNMLLGVRDPNVKAWRTRDLISGQDASVVLAVKANKARVTRIELATTASSEARVDEWVIDAAGGGGAAGRTLLPWAQYGQVRDDFCGDPRTATKPKDFMAESVCVNTTATRFKIYVRHCDEYGSAGLALLQMQ